MDIKGKKKLEYIGLLVVLTLICAGGALIPRAIENDGFFLLADDFNAQQIPFTVALHKQIQNYGINSWMWNLDLGTSTIHGMSFYELGSPFFWLSMLFPANSFPYVVTFIWVLKYITASITSFAYIVRYLNDKKWAIIGALLYAFSGFQSINIEFYHFHDVVAFFPLLLLGIDLLMENKSRYRFIFPLAVFINCVCNYYFFVIEVIFMIFYFVIKSPKYGLTLSKIAYPLIGGVLGVGMAAMLFLPNIIYIMSNPRNSLGIYLENIVWNSRDFLFLIKNFIFPAEAQNNISILNQYNWKSMSLYIPMFGLIPVFVYLKKDFHSWLGKMIVVLLLISFSPIASSVFLLFREGNFRWWFGLVLLMSLATATVLDSDNSIELRFVSVLYGLSALLYTVIICNVSWSKESDESIIFDYNKLFFLCMITIFGAVIIFIASYMKNNYILLLIMTSLFCLFTTSFSIKDYCVKNADDYEINYINKYSIATNIKTPNEQYRFIASDNLITLPGEANGTSSFSSTVEASIVELDRLFGYTQSSNTRMIKSTIEGLSELLGGKYYLSRDEGETNLGEYSSGDMTLYLHEVEACPIGFAVNSVVLEEDIQSLPIENRAKVLMSAVIVNDSNSFLCEEYDIVAQENINTIDLKTLIEKTKEKQVSQFFRDQNGFSCTTNFLDNSLVCFSVPFEQGWKAEVDGNETNIINSAGMMVIEVPSGNHFVEFTYSTPGFTLGIIVSIVCLILYCIYCFISLFLKRE